MYLLPGRTDYYSGRRVFSEKANDKGNEDAAQRKNEKGLYPAGSRDAGGNTGKSLSAAGIW